MKNLEPRIIRQRLIIEAKYEMELDEEDISRFLLELGKALKMTIDIEPFIRRTIGVTHAGLYGYVHWIESGSHIYAWENFKFLSVDIYTCKHFSVDEAVNFVKDFFTTNEIVFKEV
ncbi:MAG: S-adenosylmethionine decarboxylase [Thermoplasmata archaeon]|nr:MAG: S-adenosylmethionine decarboxylase [Thermoplasmata archaeon]